MLSHVSTCLCTQTCGDISGIILKSSSNSTYFAMYLFPIVSWLLLWNLLKSKISHLKNNPFHVLWPGFAFPWLAISYPGLKWKQVWALGLSRPKQHIFRNCKSWGHQEEDSWSGHWKTWPALCVWISKVTVETRSWDLCLRVIGSLWRASRKRMIGFHLL